MVSCQSFGIRPGYVTAAVETRYILCRQYVSIKPKFAGGAPMTDPAASVNTVDDVDARSARGSSTAYPGTPRWVKVGGIVALAVIVLVVLVMAVAGGEHGPMRHMPSGSRPSNSPITAVRV
jgi:hypothetical protein